MKPSEIILKEVLRISKEKQGQDVPWNDINAVITAILEYLDKQNKS